MIIENLIQDRYYVLYNVLLSLALFSFTIHYYVEEKEIWEQG